MTLTDSKADLTVLSSLLYSRITPGFRLPARFVIHAVGPVWRGGEEGEPGLLASAYGASIALARENGVASIAFPAIGTGIYGYPLQEATRIAVSTIRDDLAKAGTVARVIFACFNEETLRAYVKEGVAASA